MDKANKLKHYGWRLGDRYDGWRVRKVDALFSVAPFILTKRVDSEVMYKVNIPIDNIERFIKEQRDEIPGLTVMHVVMAALIRMISQRPYINRFIVWNKIYARNHISMALAIKRSMTDDGEETVVKTYFQPGDTISDVVRRMNIDLKNNRSTENENSSDMISRIMGYFPDVLIRTIVFLIRQLDNIGLMPKFFFDASPFHASMFLTNIGSIGVKSIYHHLYEFGTCSVFVAMGRKERSYRTNKEGEVISERHVELKFVLDERICDGYYYASSMRLLEKILAHPENLLLRPECVEADKGVGRARRDI